MFVPFQSASRRRRRGRSLGLAISLTVALGLAGLHINTPPIPPPGVNPSKSGRPKKCPACGQAARSKRRGRYKCLKCGKKFKAADADDYP
jgi:tRNA(Ile2) C34 agmatinyltransferase TiaS